MLKRYMREREREREIKWLDNCKVAVKRHFDDRTNFFLRALGDGDKAMKQLRLIN